MFLRGIAAFQSRGVVIGYEEQHIRGRFLSVESVIARILNMYTSTAHPGGVVLWHCPGGSEV